MSEQQERRTTERPVQTSASNDFATEVEDGRWEVAHGVPDSVADQPTGDAS